MADPVTSTDLWGKFVSFIREFGLPSFLVIWFLFRIEKKLEKFTETLGKLTTVVVVMLKSLDKDDEADSLLSTGTKDRNDLLEEAKGELEPDEHPKKKGRGHGG